ncbi:hypothetical protein Bca4012_044097 [Brassica carinata]
MKCMSSGSPLMMVKNGNGNMMTRWLHLFSTSTPVVSITYRRQITTMTSKGMTAPPYHEPVDQQSNKNMIAQPMIPHSFNIHHPSQAIPQTHTGQRQAYTNQIHTKPSPVPKPDLGLNVRTCKQINQQPNTIIIIRYYE